MDNNMSQTAVKDKETYSAETLQEAPQQQTASELIEKYTINGCTPINAGDIVETANTVKNCQGFRSGDNWTGNKAGRPKGSLNKIQSLFYDDLYQDWQEHGIQAVESMRLDSPTKYCQLVASIMPKSLEIETDGTKWVINAQPGLSTDQWLATHNLIESQPDTNQEDSD